MSTKKLYYINFSLDKIPESHVKKHASGNYLDFVMYPLHYLNEYKRTHNLVLKPTEQEILDGIPKITFGYGKMYISELNQDYWIQFWCNINLDKVPEDHIYYASTGERFLNCILDPFKRPDISGNDYGIYLGMDKAKGDKQERIRIGHAKSQAPRYKRKENPNKQASE